jgi:hypothetical protein
MTSKRLGEMFKGDSADMCARKFPLVSVGGESGHVKRAQTGREDPHLREQNYHKYIHFLMGLAKNGRHCWMLKLIWGQVRALPSGVAAVRKIFYVNLATGLLGKSFN